jgi:hypothetical protein
LIACCGDNAVIGWIWRVMLAYHQAHPIKPDASDTNAWLSRLSVGSSRVISTQWLAIAALSSRAEYMRQQTRPFVVEVKQKRGARKPAHSIWGDIDLSPIAAEARKEVHQSPDGQRVDSNVTVIDAEAQHKLRAEKQMADPQEAESTQIPTEAPAKPTPEPKKKKAARSRKTKTEATKPAVSKRSRQAPKAAEAPVPATRAPRKIYSEKERAQKLSQIEKAIAYGATIKNAVGQSGISEQTYYQWKKATAVTPKSDDLKDLLALEEENKRLKKMLAEHLRKENAELKNKLGLA